MAELMECPDCGGDVSPHARSCPHCGCPFVVDAPRPSRPDYYPPPYFWGYGLGGGDSPGCGCRSLGCLLRLALILGAIVLALAAIAPFLPRR